MVDADGQVVIRRQLARRYILAATIPATGSGSGLAKKLIGKCRYVRIRCCPHGTRVDRRGLLSDKQMPRLT